MTIDGRTYEAIPVELILKAGLLAAARLLQPAPAEGVAPAVIVWRVRDRPPTGPNIC